MSTATTTDSHRGGWDESLTGRLRAAVGHRGSSVQPPWPMKHLAEIAARVGLDVAGDQGRPVLMGIAGGPGAGKTTLARAIIETAETQVQKSAAMVSLEDFYLSREERLRRGHRWRA